MSNSMEKGKTRWKMGKIYGSGNRIITEAAGESLNFYIRVLNLIEPIKTDR